MNASQPEGEERPFEQSLAQLEALVAKLENDDVGLDDAILCYEEGISLASKCLDRLSSAELRVQELSLDSIRPLREG